jgi:YVTN family beta-propeller protein
MEMRPYPRFPALLLLALAVRASAEPGAVAERVYVSNEDSGDLSIIATEPHEVIETIRVGKRPRGLKVSPDGRTVFVALSGSPKCPPTMSDEECAQRATDKTADGIAQVDTRTREVVQVLPGGSDPEQFDVSWSRRWLYVSNEDAHQATIVDLASGRILHTLAVGREPEGVRLSPDGRLCYVTGETDHDITVIDAATGTVVGRIPVGKRPRDVVFSHDGSRAYVSAEIDGTVAVIDVEAGKVIAQIELPEGSRPMGVAVSPRDEWLYVANGRGRTVSKIRLEDHSVVASTEVGPRPWGIALSRDGTRLYSANGPSNDVTVVDTGTMKIVTRIAVGESPWTVVVGAAPAPE